MSQIRLLVSTMTHHGDEIEVENHWTPNKIAKAIASLVIAGFQEDAVAATDLHMIGNELAGVGRALGEKLNLAEKYDRIPAESAEAIREALGLLYISQLAQGQAFGAMTRDPVVALAMSQTWNQLHIDMPVDDELDENQQERFHALVDSDEEGDFPEMVAADQIGNYNRTGCICGRDHAPVSADKPVSELTNAELMATIPDELRPVLGLLSGATGKTEEEIAEYLRDSFLNGERPGVAMERLLRAAPKVTEHEIDATGVDIVEQLMQQALSSLPPLRQDQRDALRAQLEAQRAEIEATAKKGGVQALNIKLPK